MAVGLIGQMETFYITSCYAAAQSSVKNNVALPVMHPVSQGKWFGLSTKPECVSSISKNCVCVLGYTATLV